MLKNLYSLLMCILLNGICIHEGLAASNAKNYCNELQDFLSVQSSHYLTNSVKYSCFEKDGFYHVYPNKYPKNVKKIPSYTVEDYYGHENVNSKKKILDIFFIKGIK